MEPVTRLQAIGTAAATGLAVSQCVVFFARTYFGSILTEKAKTFVSKEDIADSTKLVEQVKHQFSTDLEDHRTKSQFRMAALDKRLQAHQEAFSLWRELFRSW